MAELQYVGGIKEADQLNAIEARLRAVLVPVPLRTGYMQDLKRRLYKENGLEIEKPRPPLVQSVFLTAAGLLSGVLLIALGIRGVLALVNSLGGLQPVKNGITQKKTAPAQPLC